MIINRNEARKVTEAEEELIREEITHFTRPTCTGGNLHIPRGSGTDPLCPYTQRRRWRLNPVKSWPTGHNTLCSHCADEYLDGR